MVRINSINGVNNIYFKQNEPAKDNGSIRRDEINELQDIKPDFNVQTPIAYKKIDTIDLPFDLKAHVYKLANGQKVIIIPQDGKTVLKTYVNTGSMNETDNIRGISHFIEHNLFNGSVGIENGDFFDKVNKMGASTNASTGFAETNYYISSNLLDSEDFENELKLHSAMLQSPLFLPEKIEKEKDIVNSEINMITSDPQNIAINRMLKNLYDINTKSTDMIGGTTDNISNLTKDDVIKYFNENYYPANMVTVITGDVEPDKTIEKAAKYFNSNKQPKHNVYNEKLTPITKQVREDIISDKATAAQITVGFNGAKCCDIKDSIYIDALLELFANSKMSRLGNFADKLNADVCADIEKISTKPDAEKAVIINAECSDENSEKVLKTIFSEIGNFKNNPPDNNEIEAIKKSMLKQFSTVFESSSGTNSIIGRLFLENNTDYVKIFEDTINNMTTDDLLNTAEKYFDINKTSTVVVHPASATKESIEANYKNISFTGAVKKQPINKKNVKEYKFDNQYRLITINKNTDNSDILYKLKTDIDFKPEPACEAVLEEILNQGNIFNTKEQMTSSLAQKGIESNFTASAKCITASISCDKNSISEAFKNINEVLSNPNFTIDAFEKAKSKIKDNILRSEKSAYDKLDCELFKGLPQGVSKEDLIKSLDKLTLDDIIVLYNDIISHSQGVVTVSAPYERNPELKNEVFSNISTFNKVREFKNYDLPQNFEPIDNTKVLTDVHSKNQAEIVEAYKFKINGNIKDIASLELLNIILGGNPSSRLFSDLRENEKLAYHVSSNISYNDDIGTISLNILTTTDNKETGEQHFDNVEKSIEGFKRHIENITSEHVSSDELNNAKLMLKNIILNQNHSSFGKSLALINDIFTPYGTQKENILYDEIDKITAEDILNTAKYVFKGSPVYSILASEDTLDANKEYLKNLEL